MKNMRKFRREKVNTTEMGFRISKKNDPISFNIRMLGAPMGKLCILPADDVRTTTISITCDVGREEEVRSLFESIETGPEEFMFSTTIPYIDEVLLLKKVANEHRRRISSQP